MSTLDDTRQTALRLLWGPGLGPEGQAVFPEGRPRVPGEGKNSLGVAGGGAGRGPSVAHPYSPRIQLRKAAKSREK